MTDVQTNAIFSILFFTALGTTLVTFGFGLMWRAIRSIFVLEKENMDLTLGAGVVLAFFGFFTLFRGAVNPSLDWLCR